ncbi:MAG: hypothetical protein JST39_08085 [Bacteroidetes bacterium]|nr:hypothetical protein [Bacteroidota bacterium]
MKEQSYKNHIRYYPPHHFIFYPVMLAFLALTAYGWQRGASDHQWLWLAIGGLGILTAWSSYMMRQHYALTVQNRVVRLEMRFRYFALTGQRLEPLEQRLSFGQLAALRFASDEELPGLLKRTLDEGLTPDAIKRSVKSWVADDMRV